MLSVACDSTAPLPTVASQMLNELHCRLFEKGDTVFLKGDTAFEKGDTVFEEGDTTEDSESEFTKRATVGTVSEESANTKPRTTNSDGVCVRVCACVCVRVWVYVCMCVLCVLVHKC